MICPHKNTAHFGGAAPDELRLEGAREMLRRSDAVFCVRGWRKSAGATAEVVLATELGLPVFRTVGEMRVWLKSRG